MLSIYLILFILIIVIASLLFISHHRIQGAGWKCPELGASVAEYGKRCIKDPLLGWNMRSECETSCLTPNEKITSIDLIRKFTSHLHFPVPDAFLLEIEKDPSGFFQFLDDENI